MDLKYRVYELQELSIMSYTLVYVPLIAAPRAYRFESVSHGEAGKRQWFGEGLQKTTWIMSIFRRKAQNPYAIREWEQEFFDEVEINNDTTLD
jgi:hypothetical protein